MNAGRFGSLYVRWVGANALGELLGLGLTLLVGYLFFSATGEPQAVAAVLLAFLVAVTSGVIEAVVVGFLQHWAMARWFPTVSRRAWFRGTLIGALAAYVLGYLPSTAMSLGEQTTGAPVMTEPPQAVVLLLAAGMGLVGGAVLSFGQYPALKGIPGARGWIPANMLAWALGMPVIFWGMDRAQAAAVQPGQSLALPALNLMSALLLAGAVVGAVHGVSLVRMAKMAADRATGGRGG